jgi:hypothetical protein
VKNRMRGKICKRIGQHAHRAPIEHMEWCQQCPAVGRIEDRVMSSLVMITLLGKRARQTTHYAASPVSPVSLCYSKGSMAWECYRMEPALNTSTMLYTVGSPPFDILSCKNSAASTEPSA